MLKMSQYEIKVITIALVRDVLKFPSGFILSIYAMNVGSSGSAPGDANVNIPEESVNKIKLTLKFYSPRAFSTTLKRSPHQ